MLTKPSRTHLPLTNLSTRSTRGSIADERGTNVGSQSVALLKLSVFRRDGLGKNVQLIWVWDEGVRQEGYFITNEHSKLDRVADVFGDEYFVFFHFVEAHLIE